MKKELRETNIGAVGDVDWGTHFCVFYQTRDDLLDILVPYFKAGLENNEFCMWVTSEPLNKEQAQEALEKAMPDFKRYLEQGQIEIIPYTEWYIKGGKFESKRVLAGWIDRLNRALERGYNGLRLTGNTFWLEKKGWKGFTAYEEEINNVIGKYRMIAICTYSLDKCGAAEIMDVVVKHQFALIKREGKWEMVESHEHKKAHETLRIAQFCLEQVADAILWIGPEGDIHYVNEEACRSMGYSRQELLSMKVSDIDPNFPQEVWARHWKDIKKRHHFNIESLHRAKDGRIFPVEVMINYFKLEDKEYNCAFARDITERKSAEAILKKDYAKIERQIRIRNSMLKLLTRTSSRKEYLDIIVKLIRGLSGCRCVGIRLRNEADQIPYESYLGFSRKFWESENRLFLLRDQCACIRIVTGKPEPQDMKVMTKFGSFCCDNMPKFIDGLSAREKSRFRGVCVESGFKSIAIIPIRYKNTIIGAMHLADENEDKVPLKIIEFIESLALLIGEGIVKFNLIDNIRKSNELLERVFSSTNFLIAYLDDKFNFIRVNQAYAQADSRTPDFFIGKNHFELYPNRENEGIFRRVVETGEPYSAYAKPFIYAEHPERGTTYWDWSLQPVKDASGKVEGLIFFLVDVTKHKLAERELIKTQKELNDAKRLSDIGILAATVAHELRSPLAAIKMAAYNVKKKAQNQLLDRHLDNIEKKVAESDQIINNLLFYSRIKIPQYENVDIHDILDECIGYAKSQFPKNKIAISREFSCPKHTLVNADPLQMKELFSNILNNAYDAILNRQGKIIIGTKLINASFIRIYVKDNGCGIAEENLSRIYEPFFTTKSKGTGLGLSVCYQIIRIHSGSIDVDSQLGKGTTVSVLLPVIQNSRR
jgi:PAS domain S-box-containing protein